MSELVICRGLPASGKTTKAKAWVAEDPVRRARVNRDDLRAMVHDRLYLGRDTERQILAARDATISSLLAKGVSVVCDDTNLPQRMARDVAKLGRLARAEVLVWDLTDVPLATCIERDQAREDSVGEDVIRGMHERFLASAAHPLPLPTEMNGDGGDMFPYAPVEGTPKAIIVDIDGTVALHGTRSPFDESRIHEDRPNLPVVAAVHALHAAGHAIIFCSGRTDGCRTATEEWLNTHVAVPREALFMRATGDTRKDAIVKREIFDAEIRSRYDIVAVLDDRQQVVDAWRELGLTVFQVAPGQF